MVVTPQENDVLSGKSNKIRSHSGNLTFRKLVTERAQDYAKATASKKGSKKRIVEEIIKEIQNSSPRGRFLHKGSNESNSWVEVTDHQAIYAQVVAALDITAADIKTSSNTQPTPSKATPSKTSGKSNLFSDEKTNVSKAKRRLSKNDRITLERLLKQGSCCLMIDSVPTTVKLENFRFNEDDSKLYVTALDIDDGNDTWELDVKALIQAATEAEELGFYEVECYIGKERAKNGSYMIRVRWTTGEETLEPLKQVKEDDPVGLAFWAKKQGLEKHKSFHWITKVLEKANSKKVYVKIFRSATSGGGYLVKVKDSIGQESFVPLSEAKETDPIGLALFARKEGLEKQPSFRWVTDILTNEGAPPAPEKKVSTSTERSLKDEDVILSASSKLSVSDLKQGAKQATKSQLSTQKKSDLTGALVGDSKKAANEKREAEPRVYAGNLRKAAKEISEIGDLKKAAKEIRKIEPSTSSGDFEKAAKRPLFESEEVPHASKKPRNVALASTIFSDCKNASKQDCISEKQASSGLALSPPQQSEEKGTDLVDLKRNRQVQKTSQPSHVSKAGQNPSDRLNIAPSLSSHPPSKSPAIPSKPDAQMKTKDSLSHVQNASDTSQRYRFCWV
mmetsp:Transcript_6849/g.10070  ORF Transcript_6849/g.10070 Transcript_6849/m.10070 type:complete len:619 (-) Transcript_6849:186-2042(-)|eukprot:CAMPEP_0196819046 /NCGR_PEP_ID=MMETSP1362-20130617/68786_1 /TAXON_ID=163516 /ORGANISM="Leptocylindrus danicus, Strain CCMP1856" /LENGTH=618 /DNA_ID=CAMNT_0042197391 /DNA_START=84 /DNA_END=1940 /DNA_ORIENTATION=+